MRDELQKARDFFDSLLPKKEEPKQIDPTQIPQIPVVPPAHTLDYKLSLHQNNVARKVSDYRNWMMKERYEGRLSHHDAMCMKCAIIVKVSQVTDIDLSFSNMTAFVCEKCSGLAEAIVPEGGKNGHIIYTDLDPKVRESLLRHLADTATSKYYRCFPYQTGSIMPNFVDANLDPSANVSYNQVTIRMDPLLRAGARALLSFFGE